MFHLTVESEIHLPELISVNASSSKFSSGSDIKIRVGGVSAPTKEKTIIHKVNTRLAIDHFLLDLPKIGKFCAETGETINIERHPATDDASIRCFLLETVLAALLFQRGYLVFCGSAVLWKGEAFAFLGLSRT